jgi:PAS domain S-box-containing protein
LKWSSEKKILLGGIITLAFLIINACASYQAINRLTVNEQWVAHTQQVLTEIEATFSALKDAESGQRGYLITGQEPYLEPYENAISELNDHLEKLRQLTLDNPNQQARLPVLETKIAERIARLKRGIELRRGKDIAGAQNYIVSGAGKRVMDDIRQFILVMEDEEKELLKRRADESRDSRRNAVLTFVAASLIACALLFIFSYALIRDITRRNQAEELLAQQREWLQVTLSSIGDAVIATDTDGTINFINGVAQSLTGWKEEEAIGQPLEAVFNIVNEDTRKKVENPALRAIKEGIIVGLANHTILLAKDGREVPIDDSGAPVRDKTGAMRGAVLIFRDILEGKQVEERLRESEESFRATFEQAAVGIAHVAVDGRWLLVNQRLCEIVGYTREELLARTFQDITHPDDLETDMDFVRQMLAGKISTYSMEKRYLRNDSSIIWINLTASMVRDAAGAPKYFISVVENIAERKQTAEALRASEQQLRAIYDGTYEYIGLLTLEGILLDANRASLEFGNSKHHEVVGLPFWETIWFKHTPGAPELVQQAIGQAAAGEFVCFEAPIITPEGNTMMFEISFYPIRNQQGEVILIVPEGRDVTERTAIEKEREQLLIREQEARTTAEIATRAKDEFLAILSHELRAPLNAMMGWTRLLQGGHLDREQTSHGLEVIARNVNLQTALIEDLLDVSRIVSGKILLESELISLVSIVESTLDAFHLAAEERRIKIESSFELDADEIFADKDRLQQVVSNLLTNALKFTPAGGVVKVLLRRKDDNAELVVKDSGIGIAPEILPHIFERFKQADSSSKRKYGGLGLGLTIVRHLVELHGGTVAVHSDGENTGATFTIRLPLAPPIVAAVEINAADEASRNSAEDSRQLASLRILLVDDDKDSLDLMSILLATEGAQVTYFDNASQVFKELEMNQYDLLISDVGMPDMSGHELIQKVRESIDEEKLPAIALTGYASAEDRAQVFEAGFQAHLPKPIDFEKLQSLILSLIQRDRSSL